MPSTEKLKEIQARSGLHFAFFLAMHFVCHVSLAVLGWDAGNSNLRWFRKLYQHKLFESLMLLSVLAHLYSNAALFIVRRKLADATHASDDDDKKKKKDELKTSGALERQFHRIAGYVLALGLVGHVVAVRIGPLYVLEDPSLYDYGFVYKASRDELPEPFFLAYLAVFGMAGVWHMTYGVASALQTFRGSSLVGKPFSVSLKVLALLGCVGIVGAVLAVGGYLYPIDISDKDAIMTEYYDTMMNLVSGRGEAAEL